jgi:hypothetical protein
MNPYIDEFGFHIGYCNACDADGELGQDCPDCDLGEVVPYDDDPDPDE